MRVTRKERKIQALRQTVQSLNQAQGRVGWFPSAVYETGAPVAGVAMVQEFGDKAGTIPPRLGMRATAADKREEWAETAAKVTRAAAQGKIAPANIMPAICLAAEGAIRQTITKVSSPPLKSATIAARKRKLAKGGRGAKASIEKPLVDTGILLNTLTSEVDAK